MRIAFVVQRYGREVNGGAEHHCRMLAERLARRLEPGSVTVLTTCAKDYRSWSNHYAPGVEEIAGVRVERFPTALERASRTQEVLGAILRCVPHLDFLERAWLRAQGPVTPGLLERLTQVKDDYDVFVFFTYLYYPTVLGLPRLPGRRILIPTAHDEPAIRLKLFRAVFEAPEGLAFNSEEERDFTVAQFAIDPARSAIVGCGVDVPEAAARPINATRDRPFLLYLGRLARNKGIPELVRGFAEFKRRHTDREFQSSTGVYRASDLTLVLAGAGDERLLPNRPDVIFEGFVSDTRKAELLASAEVLVMPSRYESLSLVTLEAWMLGAVVLVERSCDVTAGHVARAEGGAAYHGVDEFCDAVAALLSDRSARREMAARGKRYVESRYAWPLVEERFLDLARRVAAKPR